MKKLSAYFTPRTIKYLAVVALGQAFTYYLPMLLKISGAHLLSSRLDSALPFIPGFAYIYVAAFALWVCGFVYSIDSSEYMARRLVLADMLCKAVCVICFIFYPCTLSQPDPSAVNGFGAWLLKLVWTLDQPINLLPSMHCYMSHLVVRPLLDGYFKQITRPWRIALYIFVLLIYLSTLFTKQHVIIDVIAGVALAELMWRASGLIVRKSE